MRQHGDEGALIRPNIEDHREEIITRIAFDIELDSSSFGCQPLGNRAHILGRDMALILARMDGDPAASGGEDHVDSVDEVGNLASARISQRGDLIDIDAELNHSNQSAACALKREDAMPPFEIIQALRFAKFLAIALYGGGILAVFAAESVPRRRSILAWIVGPSFLATWTLGFFLAFMTETRLLSAFVIYTLAASFLALQAALYYGSAEGRSRRGAATLAAIALLASYAFMVYRHQL